MRSLLSLWLVFNVIFAPNAQAESERGVAILQYHHVGDDTPRVTSVTTAELEAHFELLQELDMSVLSLTEAQQRIATGTLPERAAAITFDDGWANIYDNGLPLFKRYRLPFTIFINPQLMADNPSSYMSWEQLRELEKYGATIANHTNQHQHMTWRQPGQSETQWLQSEIDDVLAAQQQLETHLGPTVKQLAYPFGEFEPRLAARLQALGFIAFGQHSGAWGQYSPLGAIPRFPASGLYANTETLRTKLLSLPLPVRSHRPANMVLTHQQKQPHLQVELVHLKDFRASQLQCFFNGQVLKPEWDGLVFELQLTSDLAIGRSRVNCTVASLSQAGRFYWYSIPLVRPDQAGRWPD